MPMNTPSDLILDAAEARFADYGYNKTTMAEIAGDCAMSVGNLYRHFKNKETIALASVKRILQGKLDAGIAAAENETDSLDALRAFLQTRLRIGHAHFADTRHQFDMMELINTHHRKLLLDYEARVIQSLAEIIRRGKSQGHFGACNAEQTAYDIHQATLRYNNPLHLKVNELSVLERDLNRLIDLLYRGLSC